MVFASLVICFGQSDFTASASQQSLLKKLNTSISGYVHNPTEKTIQITYHKSSLNFNSESINLPISDEGTFKVDFDLVESTELNLVYDGTVVPLFLQKGDDLQIAFEGNDFYDSIHFDGRGGMNNQFLIEASRKFKAFDEGYIRYIISNDSPEEYAKKINNISEDRFDFYNNYPSAAKSKMTADFKEYIQTDYTYWRANHLLNYRVENPLLNGKEAPLILSSSYYDFISDLDFKDHVLLSSKNYCEFLEEFLKFKGEVAAIEESQSLAKKVVTQPNMLIDEDGNFTHINPGDRVIMLSEDQSVLNKEAVSRILPAFKADALDYIKLENGTTGWVRNLSAGTLVKENSEEVESRIKKYGICNQHNAKLIKNPGESREVITALGYGEEINYLHLKTSENFEYYHQGREYYGKLVEVETKRGHRGWILESFIKVMEKKVFEKENPGTYLYSLTGTSEARQYLEGKALYYSLAKALYWKIKLNQSKDIAREIAAFGAHNEFKVFNDILRAEYDVEQLRKKSSDEYIETYAYSNLKSPVVAGVRIGLPFDNSAFVSATKAQSKANYVHISNELADRPSSLVNIKGKIEGGYLKNASLTLIYDYISYKEETVNLVIDKAGNYAFSEDLRDPVMAILKCGNKNLDLYLYPGDNININFSANNFPNSVRFEGKSASLNTYLFEEQKMFAEQFDLIEGNLKNLSAKEFSSFSKDLFKKRKQYFDKYKKNNSLYTQDELFILSNIRYHYASMLFNYEDVQKYVQNREHIELPKNFYSPIFDIPYSVEGVLPNMHYITFIQQFIDYQYKNTENANSDKMDLAKQYFTGEVLAYVQAKELARKCQIGKALEVGHEISAYLNSNTYKQYSDLLRVVYNEYKPIQTGDLAPDFVLRDLNGNEVKLSTLRGKVVYIDFWATWCRPCMKSMTYSQRLTEKYKNENIVFLYVSMDKNSQVWENYVSSQQLAGTHLNAKCGSGYLSDIARLYKVKQLPTFILIDKDGKIAFNKAGSPGSKVISNLIDGLLETPRF